MKFAASVHRVRAEALSWQSPPPNGVYGFKNNNNNNNKWYAHKF